LPLEPARAELAGPVGSVLEEQPADAAADPGRVDPEVLEPADLAARDQRRPADRGALGLGDEDEPGAQALGFEVAAHRPVLHARPVVTPVRLGLDRDLP